MAEFPPTAEALVEQASAAEDSGLALDQLSR